MPSIECSNVSKVYGGACALVDFTLGVERGEVFGLLGPNGAGKTTLFRVLLGLAKMSGGSARVLGDEVPLGASSLSRIGALLEEPAFYPWMTAGRFLATMSDSRKVPVGREAANATLERVGLSVGKKPIRKYSQGMRQRLGIAQALMGKPDLLILDEPANGLDPEGIEWLRFMIREEAAAGVTVLVSSHQLGEVERICDRVGILHEGRLLEVGTTAGIGGESGRIKVVVRSEDHEKVARALGQFTFDVGGPGTFYVIGSDNTAVGMALSMADVMPETMVREQSSLEQRFLAITAGVNP